MGPLWQFCYLDLGLGPSQGAKVKEPGVPNSSLSLPFIGIERCYS